jgi:hypothetical protein
MVKEKEGIWASNKGNNITEDLTSELHDEKKNSPKLVPCLFCYV